MKTSGGTVFFSNRKRLAELFERWAEENGVKKSPEGVMDYLQTFGLLNADKVNRFIVESRKGDE